MEDVKVESMEPVPRKRKAPVKKPKAPKNDVNPEPQNLKEEVPVMLKEDPHARRMEDIHNSMLDMNAQFIKLKKELNGRLAEHAKEYDNRIEKVPSIDEIETRVLGKVNDMVHHELKGYDDKLDKQKEYFKSKHKKIKSKLNDYAPPQNQRQETGWVQPEIVYRHNDKLTRPSHHFGPFGHSYNGR